MSTDKEQLYKKLLDEDDVEALTTKPGVVVKSTARRPRSPRSSGVPCWCKCLLITVGLFTTLAVMVSVVSYVYVKDLVQHLTVTTPHVKFPVVDMTEAELAVVKDRVVLFVDKIRAGQAAKPLVVTQDEINGFLGHSDYLRGNMMVTLQEGAILEDYSLPTGMLPGGSGRYFVGQDHLNVDEKECRVEFQMDTAAKHEDWFKGPLVFAKLHYLTTKDRETGKTMLQLFVDQEGSFLGNDIPQEFIDQHQNLLDGFYDDEDNENIRAVVEGIERVDIHEGKIVVTPRRQLN